ncbi:MAG: universal stress protein [Sandaracinaceae bacterium]
MRLNRIIVPTDFSEVAANALTEARALASESGAPLVLVHVWDRAAMTLNLPYLRTAQEENLALVNSLEEGLQRSLDEQASVVFEGIPVSTKLLHDASTARALATFAEPDDVIVISTHGRSGVVRFVVGSVTEKLIRLARCRVLTVPPTPEEEAA